MVDLKKVKRKVKGAVAVRGGGSGIIEVKTEESVVVKEEDVLARDVT